MSPGATLMKSTFSRRFSAFSPRQILRSDNRSFFLSAHLLMNACFPSKSLHCCQIISHRKWRFPIDVEILQQGCCSCVQNAEGGCFERRWCASSVEEKDQSIFHKQRPSSLMQLYSFDLNGKKSNLETTLF